MAVRDLKGERFGRLEVVEFVGIQNHFAMWLCRCDCGNTTIVRGGNLTAGQVRSCGCLAKLNGITHGGSKTRLYRIWYGIIRRTEDATRDDYKRYGAKGIRICDEWRHDFVAFRDWALSNGYDDTLSIDRIDNLGNYEPSNCCWVSKSAQENNKRLTKRLTVDGISKTPAEWERVSGIPASRIRRRIKAGWDNRRAVFEPLDSSHQHGMK